MRLFSSSQPNPSTKALVWIGLIVAGAAAMALMIYITPNGLGLVNDSIAYIGGARSLVSGDGYSRLTGNGTPEAISNYPPMLSLVTAGIVLLGVDAIRAVWYLNVALFGINAMLLGYVLFRITGQAGFSLLAAVLCIISEPFLRTYSFAMSEPLYLCLTFAALITLMRFIETQHWGWIFASGVLASVAFLTRYVGVTLYATVLLTLLVSLKAWRPLVRYALVFLGGGLPAVLVWLVRNMRVSDNAANRQISYHPIPVEKIQEGLLNFWGWLLPERGDLLNRLLPVLGVLLGIGLLGLAVAVVLGAWQRWQGQAYTRPEGFLWLWVFGLHGVVYLGVLVFSLTFVDASPIFEHRILSPFYLSFLVVGVTALAWLWSQRGGWAKAAVVVVALALGASFMEDSLDVVRDLHKEGQGFAASAWMESPTIAGLEDLQDFVFYSNKPPAIYILTGKPAYYLPSPINPATQQPREDYQKDVDNIKAQILDGQSIMVIFDYDELMQIPEEKDWLDDLTGGLPVLAEYEDGRVLGLNSHSDLSVEGSS
ncbi:MAG: glycosyltransferase family 39 protein [Chloroflexi bacterium]|nr:glycosyltransferase family 39 protein [Chloroflexota bacterium]